MSEETDRAKFIDYFENLTTFNGKEFDEIIKHVHDYALKYGLDKKDMTLVASKSLQYNLNLLRIRKLVNCLLPRRYVSQETVKLILKQLIKHKGKSVLILKQYLQWIIGVIEFSLVETKDDIKSYYELFCYFMNFDIIDISATKIVYFLTTPNHITTRFSIVVRKLYRSTNNNHHFAALLYLCKCYRPELVPEKIPIYPARKAFGRLSNVILENFLCAKTRINKHFEIDEDEVWNKFGIETSERAILVVNKSISEKNATKLYRYIKSKKEHSCVLSLLNNPTGMFMINFSGLITHKRLSYQLYFILYDDRNPDVTYEERDKILEKIANLQDFLEQPIPVVSKFIGQYLMRWDGQEHEKQIYNILEWMHVKSFTEYRQCVLTYLLHLFKSSSVEVKCRILNCIGNFAVNVISLYRQREIEEIPAIFLDIEETYSFPEFIKALFCYLDNLCIVGIALERNNPALLSTAVIIQGNIIDAGAKIGIKFKMSRHIPFTALVSPIPNALNEMCRLINTYPYCIYKAVQQDYIDCLLRDNAFNCNPNKLSIFYGFDKSKYSIKKLEKQLSIKRHYAFYCYTYKVGTVSDEELEKSWKIMRRTFPDLFKFLQKYI